MNTSYGEEMIEQEYNMPTDEWYKDSLEYKKEDNTSKVVHIFLSMQTCLNEMIKLIERKVLKCTHCPMTIKEIKAGC